jgi:AAA domain/Bifunctional DNA primase/polymerase, N-terminal
MLLLDPIYELVTRKTVLLEARSGTKHPIAKGAQKITLEETLTPAYQRKLAHAAANSTICARLGVLSCGLLTIDLDVDDSSLAKAVYERLLSLNPRLSHTLTSRGRPTRCQIWFRVIGEFPYDKDKLIISLEDGTKIGELRNGEGNQWQSVLTGIHPETRRPYTFLIEEPAIEIHWSELIWPPEWVLSWNKSKADQPRGGGTSDYEWTRKFKGCDLNRLNLAELLRAEGLKVTLIKEKSGKDEEEKYAVCCPWLGQHTMDGGEREAVSWQKIGDKWPTFQCSHTHCTGKGLGEVLEWVESKEPGIVERFCSREPHVDASQSAPPPIGGGDGAQDDRFFPSTIYQEVPDWAVPIGGEYHHKLVEGKSWMYWDEPVPGPETVFDKRTNQCQRAGPKISGPSPDPFLNQPKPQSSDSQKRSAAGSVKSVLYEPPVYEVHNFVELADTPIDPTLNLLGNEYLSRGEGMLIVGPTEVGKSSLAIQMATEWACGLKGAIIKPNGPLRVLIVQSEDSRNEVIRMLQVYRRLGLAPEQIELVKANTRFITWSGCGRLKKKPPQKDDEKEWEEVTLGRELVFLLEMEKNRGGEFDIVIINPLHAYTEESTNTRFNKELCYQVMTPFLRANKCGLVWVHHTPKFKKEMMSQTRYEMLYLAAGDATITNWTRSSLFVMPTDREGFFEFWAGKRAGKDCEKIDWNSDTRIFKWADGYILWTEATSAEASATRSKAKKTIIDLLRLIPLNGDVDGPISHAELESAADAAGISQRARKNWKDQLILREQIFVWAIPTTTRPQKGYAQNKPAEDRKWGGKH